MECHTMQDRKGLEKIEAKYLLSVAYLCKREIVTIGFLGGFFLRSHEVCWGTHCRTNAPPDS